MAVFCPATLRYQVYAVPIPLRLDNAYTAELYTAWVALTARGPLNDPAFGFRSGSWHFADCKGYITAQEGRREPEDSLQGDLIRACRDMASGHAPPAPPSVLAHHRHLARRPAGGGGCGGRTRCGRLPRHRGVAQSPTGAPRLFFPRKPPNPRRPAPSTPRPARLPPRLR